MRTSAIISRQPGLPTEAAPELVIGIVDLMPRSGDAGAAAQFETLLAAVASPVRIRLRLFKAAGDVVVTAGEHPVGAEPLAALWSARIDGLIITGAEPRAATMTAEPLWRCLEKLVDWAAANTVSAIWSCFAAHAAVWRMDGVARQPLTEKLSGLFDCQRATAHAILPPWSLGQAVPHSRYNTLNEKALRDHGYTILTGSRRTGPDMFTKICGASQFLFLQGHPEYAGDRLAIEYARDVKRFLSGVTTAYPKPPEHYFAPATVEALAAIEHDAGSRPRADTLAVLRDVMGDPPAAAWRDGAQCLLGGWLSFIAASKTERERIAA